MKFTKAEGMGTKAIEQNSQGAQVGNTNAVSHGLYAQTKDALKLRTRRVRRRVTNAYRLYPWLQATDRPAVRSWAELDVMTSIMFVLMEQHGVVSGKTKDGDLQVRRLVGEYRQYMTLKGKYEHELGMSPAGRLTLGVKALEGGDLAARAQAMRNGNID